MICEAGSGGLSDVFTNQARLASEEYHLVGYVVKPGECEMLPSYRIFLNLFTLLLCIGSGVHLGLHRYGDREVECTLKYTRRSLLGVLGLLLTVNHEETLGRSRQRRAKRSCAASRRTG